MTKFYVKGTDILARKSNREYHFVLMRKDSQGEYTILSCHEKREGAMASARSLIREYKRHPNDFSSWYKPLEIDFFRISELEKRLES